MKNLIYIIFILFLSCNSKTNPDLKNSENISFEKNYIGTINNKLDVVFHLKSNNGEISGFYFYNEKGYEIKLVGEISDNKINIFEYDFTNNKKALIIGKIDGCKLIGEWKNLKTSKTYKINLEESDKKIEPLPSNIEGVYNTVSDYDCNISIKIKKVKDEYFYNFESDLRKINGKISFSRDINEIYLILEGIKWESNEGNLYNEDGEIKEEPNNNLPLPTGVECAFDEDGITIQNYGNAMNSYTKLSDCGEKYIHFVKQK